MMQVRTVPHFTLVALLLLVVGACRAQAPDRASGRAPERAAADRSTASTHVPSAQARVTEIARGLEHPWAVALLPDGGYLVTERPGRLRRIAADGSVSRPIAGVPAVWAHGQAGLLDVVLAPGFASNHRIYFTYVEPGQDDTAGVVAAMATLDGSVLRDVRAFHRESPKLAGTLNLGSRIAFDRAGHVFVSQGDRFDHKRPQQLDSTEGKLLRFDLDGGIPTDNPFVGRKDVRPEIWSYGHRNIQGLAIDPRSGTLWASEHGPRGGDEINLPKPGRNYGWPIASNGMDYSTGRPYPETVGTQVPGMESPYHVWNKSPGLSGLAFLTGHPDSAWNDSLFLGALAEGNLIRLSLDGNRITGEERLLTDMGVRIRDVRVGPDGSVYVLTDEDNGRLLRLQPPSSKPH
jgi:glucose/arabinose dehydrogenase